ncbi:MAG: hypothetical protein ACI915_004031 [Gammaproteobacteria bacterium]|jgi:hypothetical protein
MSKPRASIVSVSDTPYHHCVFRSLRRAFLCGEDSSSGQSYEHRRGWFIERLAVLNEVFSIDVCAYTVMCNHRHLVLYIDIEVLNGLANSLRRFKLVYAVCKRTVRASCESGRRL